MSIGENLSTYALLNSVAVSGIPPMFGVGESVSQRGLVYIL